MMLVTFRIGVDGYIHRGIYGGLGEDDGECHSLSTATICMCKDDYCNTGSYCSQCEYPKPTPGTDTTTEEMTLTTSNQPPPTTDASTLASTPSPASLTCYECLGCSSIDSSTPVISDASYQSCVTTVSLNSGNVFRGGSYDQHPDGEC
ncbi:unnamed protein product, partial [Meganyctiphanes norvegica]